MVDLLDKASIENILGIAGALVSASGINAFTNHNEFRDYTDIKGMAAPSNPSSTYLRLYVDTSDTHLKHKSSGGTVTDLTAPSLSLSNDSVTNAILANMAANTVKVNPTAGSADPQDLALSTNEILGRQGSNITNIGISTNQVLLRQAANILGLGIGTNEVLGRLAGDIVSGKVQTAQIQSGAITDTEVNASGITTRSKLPTPVVYDDETNTYSLTQTFTKSIVANGGLNSVRVAKTGNYTLVADDSTIEADASAGAFTLTLPAAASNTGKIYEIIRTDQLASTNLLTVDANASETIDGLLTWTLAPAETLEIKSNGSNWIVRHKYYPADLGYYFLKNSTNNRRYVAGLANTNNVLLTSTTAPAINTSWALPFFVCKVSKFDTISAEVTTAQASQNFRLGLYSDNGNCYPGALIFDTGNISTGTTGVKDTTITSGLQLIQPGLYWLTFEWNATTAQIRILPGAGTCISFAALPNTMGTGGPGFAYTVAHTFGALANPYTGGATVVTTASAVGTPIPAIALRAI